MSQKDKNLSYEGKFQEVEEILKDLEKGKCSLDDLVTKVKRGYDLIASMQAKLENVQKEVQDLSDDNAT